MSDMPLSCRDVTKRDKMIKRYDHHGPLGHVRQDRSISDISNRYFLSPAAAFAAGSDSSRTGIPSLTFTSLSLFFNTSSFSFNACLPFSGEVPRRSRL